MYSWISPDGNLIKTRTIKEFAEHYGFEYSYARNLACGWTMVAKGWCSTAPIAKRKRERFLTRLKNIRTGEERVLGASITGFAKSENLCVSELNKLISGRQLYYRNWVKTKTLYLAEGVVAGFKI